VFLVLFGPRVTATQVLDNLDFIAKNLSRLKYIQIDDGYQPAMGDWLETGAAFGGNVQGVLKEIRKRGLRARNLGRPFIAEAESHVFEQHPDWFVEDAEASRCGRIWSPSAGGGGGRGTLSTATTP